MTCATVTDVVMTDEDAPAAATPLGGEARGRRARGAAPAARSPIIRALDCSRFSASSVKHAVFEVHRRKARSRAPPAHSLHTVPSPHAPFTLSPPSGRHVPPTGARGAVSALTAPHGPALRASDCPCAPCPQWSTGSPCASSMGVRRFSTPSWQIVGCNRRRRSLLLLRAPRVHVRRCRARSQGPASPPRPRRSEASCVR